MWTTPPDMSVRDTRSASSRLLDLPFAIWVLVGFGLCYLFFFLVPVFLSTNSMQFYRYVPAAEHIGIDLKQTLSFSAYWTGAQGGQYASGNNYPPVASLLFVPLLGLKFALAFQVITLISVLSYVLITLAFPAWLLGARGAFWLSTLLCVTGLVSYGFQFELERGQFDVIAVLLAFLAVLIFHRFRRLRWLAFLLFTISVQLKLYPLIFILLLVDDWEDWSKNLRTFALLAVANAALLLVFGTDVFRTFLEATLDRSSDPAYTWIGSHSIRSAVALGMDFASNHGKPGLTGYSGVLVGILSATVVACVASIVLKARVHERSGFNAYLFLACALGALLLPPYSHDYRLAILGGPTAVLLLREAARDGMSIAPLSLILRRLGILLFSFAYASTLFPYLQKPYYIANNFPALFVMLLIATYLGLSSSDSDANAVPTTEIPEAGAA